MKLLLDHELLLAFLQSRMTWENMGDANTKYFNFVASARRNKNVVGGLKDDMGT